MGTTHREIEGLCDKFMSSQGWRRALNPKLIGFLPDRVYFKENKVVIFEVKPGNASKREAQRGLGQVCFYLPYLAKPYLVISEKCYRDIEDVIKHLPWLGLLAYDETGERLTIKQRGADRSSEELIEAVSIPESVTSQVDRFLKSYCSTDNWYTLLDLYATLDERYPTTTITKRQLSSCLEARGFEKHRSGFGVEFFVNVSGVPAIKPKKIREKREAAAGNKIIETSVDGQRLSFETRINPFFRAPLR